MAAQSRNLNKHLDARGVSMLARRTIVRTCLAALLLSAAPLMADRAAAQRALTTIIVPFPAGGPTDAMARVLGEAVAERSGQSVIVDNRPGAGGQLAAGALLKAPSDGRTLFLADMSTLSSNQFLYANFSYNPLADFQPITTLISMPMVMYVRKDLPADTFAEFVQLAKTKNLNYASQGYGTPGHLLGEILRTATGAQLTHVPYRGSAPAMNDLLGGQVDMLFDGLPPGLQHVTGGMLKALTITSPHRSDLLPNVPTTAEIGLPDLSMTVWFGIVTRAGVPTETVLDLNKNFTEALKSSKVTQQFQKQGFELTPRTPADFATLIRAEGERWGAVMKAHQIRID